MEKVMRLVLIIDLRGNIIREIKLMAYSNGSSKINYMFMRDLLLKISSMGRVS
jgi:hypothetical protein